MDMQGYFYGLADHVTSLLEGSEVACTAFHGEDSDFVRFNKSEVRQAGSVEQRRLGVDLINGSRHVGGSLALSGNDADDRGAITALVEDLREKLGHVPEDPYLSYATEPQSSDRKARNELPDPAGAIADIQRAGQGRDLVGIYAAGGLYRGFANSLGQRNWLDNYNFNFDWSFYHNADKAVKSSFAGFQWDGPAFDRKVQTATQQLDALGREPKTIEPGHYRVYMAPAAMYDIFGQLSWGGFGLKAHRTKQTPLLRMVEAGAQLNDAVSISENTAEGVAPHFQGAGFIRPERVSLIDKGRYANCLVSPRSAREYGVPTNGASAAEAPESIDVAPGEVGDAGILERLDRGLYIGNVWYLNWSDRSACRTTGMTRFATFWVEGGEIQAPLNVMRFDETAYRMLGDKLIGLTRERDFILDPGTYGQRSTISGRIPGALVDDFAFTL